MVLPNNALGTLDTSGQFGAQQNMLAQALMSSKGDALANSLVKAQMFQKPLTTPTAPALKFGVDAKGIGDGVVQGLGNALNNALQMKQYGQQQDQVTQYNQRMQDLSQQMDLAAAQKQQQADLAAAEEAKFVQSLPERVRPYYQQADDVGRRAMLLDLSRPGLAPGIGEADALKKISEHDALMAVVKQYGPLEIDGKPNPAAVRAYSELIGKSAYLSTDASKAVIDVNKANVDLKKAQNDLGAQPGQLKRQALNEELGLTIKKVEAKYAEAMALADKLTAEGKITEANDLKTRTVEGRKRYDQAVAAYDTLTPGQIKLMNSQFKSLGTPYELPEKKENKLTPVKNKGKVTGFTDDQGHVYDKDGNPKG